MPELSPFASALIVKAKAPFFEWVKPRLDDDYDIEPVEGHPYVYLLPCYDEDEELLQELIDERFKFIFENILFYWTSDESKWPENRSYEVFKLWFEWEPSMHVNDTGAMEDEE